MAKQRFGINDGYRGTVGTVIGYQWRGKWCLRARPRFVRNPRTERQQRNRDLFKASVQLAGSMKEALRLGLHARALEEHMTECNRFLRLNKECFSWVDGALAVEYERLVISEGEVAPVCFDTLLGLDLTHSSPTASRWSPSPNLGEELDSFTSDRGSSSSPKLGEVDARSADGGVCQGASQGVTITLPFSRDPMEDCGAADDRVYLYAWCPECSEGHLSSPAYRSNGQVSIDLLAAWAGLDVHLYGFVTDYKGNASQSVYIGMLENTPLCHSVTHSSPTASRRSPSPNLGEELDSITADCGSSSSPKLGEVDARSADGGVCQGGLRTDMPADNSHRAVEKNLWHGSCRSDICSTFASRKERDSLDRNITQWKPT